MADANVPDWDEAEEKPETEILSGMPVIVYDVNEAYIGEVSAKYRDIEAIEPGDKTTYDMVLSGLREHRKIRLAIEERRKWNNKDAKAYIDTNNSRAKELHGLNSPNEERLKAVRQVEDDRINAIEESRIKALQDKIAVINRMNTGLSSKTADELQAMYFSLKTMPITEEDFAELAGEAMMEVHNTLINIEDALQNRKAFDRAEAERLALEAAQKAEAERLEKIRVEQEAAQKKIDEANAAAEAQKKRLAEQERQIAEREAKLEAEKKAEQNRIEREALEAELAEKAKIKALQDAKAAAEHFEQERIAKEVSDERERVRKAALKPDKEKLIDFANTFNGADIEVPVVESEEAKKILFKFLQIIDLEAESFRKQAEEL